MTEVPRLRCWAIHKTGTRCTAFMDDHGSKHLFEWDDSECLDVYARISPGHAGVPDQPPASWAQVGQPGYAAPPSPPPPRTRLEPPRVKCSACGCTEPAHDRSGGCERHECLTFVP